MQPRTLAGSASPVLPICRLVTADAQLEHASISRQHALLCFRDDGAAVLMDLDSAHGTFVGSERLAKVLQAVKKCCSRASGCQDKSCATNA